MHPGYESKTIRWGLESFNPFLPPAEAKTNRQWVLDELGDLKIAIVRVEQYFNNKEETL